MGSIIERIDLGRASNLMGVLICLTAASDASSDFFYSWGQTISTATKSALCRDGTLLRQFRPRHLVGPRSCTRAGPAGSVGERHSLKAEQVGWEMLLQVGYQARPCRGPALGPRLKGRAYKDGAEDDERKPGPKAAGAGGDLRWQQPQRCGADRWSGPTDCARLGRAVQYPRSRWAD